MGVLGAGLAAVPTPLSGQMEGKAPCRHHLRPATGCSVTASSFPTRQAGAGPGVPRAGPAARETSSSPQRRFLGSSGPHHSPNPGREPPAPGSSHLLAQGCRTEQRKQLFPGLEAGSRRSRCWKILSLMRTLCIFLWWGGREGVLWPLFFLWGYKSYPGAPTSWSPGNPKYLPKPLVLTPPL